MHDQWSVQTVLDREANPTYLHGETIGFVPSNLKESSQ